MLALFRRWSVVIFVVVAVVYLYQNVPLSPEETDTVRSQYEQEYDIGRIYARHHISGKLVISVVGVPKSGRSFRDFQKINILYDRQRSSMTELGTEPYFESPLPWFLRAVAIILILSAWLLYLDPLLGGQICPHCRRWGWLPVVLKERERTVHPTALDDKGAYWPEIIETERYCPQCSFKEFRIRQFVASLQQDLATADVISDPRISDNALRERQRLIDEKIKKEGLPQEVYAARLDAARQAAAEKSTPRD